MTTSTADRTLVARLSGTAARYASQRLLHEQRAAAVTELAELAGGRADLLAEVAGLTAGAAAGRPDEAFHLAAAQLCVEAGADPALIPHWTSIGQQRVAEASRNQPGMRMD